MQIYNANRLDNKQRLIQAIVVGVISAIGLGIIYGAIINLLHVEAPILYVFIGWCIGEIIKKYGRGVHPRFSVVGACCTLLAIMVGDTCTLLGIRGLFSTLFNPSMWYFVIQMLAAKYFSLTLYGILGAAMRAIGIYYGYNNSRIF